jgi:L-threonylcarbamoyladenylate synthase
VVLDGLDAAAIDRAAARIASGELVAFPTETVYGLGARADHDSAVARIFALKGRPPAHPLIVHVADRQRAEPFIATMPAMAERLVDAFWPGPLTVIVARRPGVADAAAAGQGTIGLRCPARGRHALLTKRPRPAFWHRHAERQSLRPKVSPTTAAHVVDEFSAALLKGTARQRRDPRRLGIESAIVDCTSGRPSAATGVHKAARGASGPPPAEAAHAAADGESPRAPERSPPITPLKARGAAQCRPRMLRTALKVPVRSL